WPTSAQAAATSCSPGTSTSPTPSGTSRTGRATGSRPVSCPRNAPTSTVSWRSTVGSMSTAPSTGTDRARTPGGPSAARPSTTTPDGASTTRSPRPLRPGQPIPQLRHPLAVSRPPVHQLRPTAPASSPPDGTERRTRRRPARISPDGAPVRTGPAAAGSAAWHATSDAAADHSLLHLGDRLGHLDAARACLGAVEGGAAAPHALLGVEDLQTLLAGIIARIEDEAMGVDDGSRTEVLPVGPEHRARGGAGGAQDALGGVVEALTLLRGLQPLPAGLLAAGDQERHDLLVGVEERLHVDDQVLLDRQPLDRLDGDGLADVEVLQQRLAGQ